MNKPEVFAVVWNDFAPLSLHFDTAQAAIDCARQMKEKAKSAGHDIARMDIRPVHVPAGTDELVILPS